MFALVKDEIDFFRKGLSLILISYYVNLLPSLESFFGFNGYIDLNYWDIESSILELSDSMVLRYVCLLMIFFKCAQLFKGTLNWFGLVLLYLLNLSFYRWNSPIIHEPQPIMNFFMLTFFFLPLNSEKRSDPYIKNMLIAFLGIYYLLSGIKKLPDPNFLDGTALYKILSWGVMAKYHDLNLLIVKYLKPLLIFLNYFVLLFELSFIFLIFTKLRKYLMVIGILFHLMIYLCLEVGNFSWVMILWYSLLLNENQIEKINSLLQNCQKKARI